MLESTEDESNLGKSMRFAKTTQMLLLLQGLVLLEVVNAQTGTRATIVSFIHNVLQYTGHIFRFSLPEDAVSRVTMLNTKATITINRLKLFANLLGIYNVSPSQAKCDQLKTKYHV